MLTPKLVIAAEVAEPEDSVIAEPMALPLSKNWTDPVAVPAPGETGATVAVKVTDCPKTEGFTEDVNVVVVGAATMVATCTALPLLIAFVVTTAVRLPSDGWVLKFTVNWVAVALPTVPTAPLLNVTVLLEAVVSNPVPAMVRVVTFIARLLVFEVTVGGATTVAVCPVKAMLFKSTPALFELEFAVRISSLPSPFTSPKVTEFGLVPVPKVA